MKYFIVGLHASGKQEVIDLLEQKGVRCGKLFSNIDTPSTEVYNSHNYELYTTLDINEMFENNAYIFINELQSSANINSYKFYEGLSKYTFDNNDVFVLSPNQLLNISPNVIKEDICFIWLDNPRINRLSRYHAEKRSYSFSERESIEYKDSNAFVKYLYSFDNSKLLYFTNEEPCRIASIIYAMIAHPDLIDMFAENFNN